MRSNPHLPLGTPEANPKNIIKKGKSSQEGFSAVALGSSSHILDSTFNTPITISSSPLLPSAEISRILDFENFPVE
jgi:hypothetical protein